jgi:hypothetical protein
MMLYLSGPMTGVKDWNHPLFNHVARHLRLRGHAVINPAEFFGGDTSRRRSEYMTEAMKALVEVKQRGGAVVKLTDWDKSPGARLEVNIAREMNIPVMFAVDVPDVGDGNCLFDPDVNENSEPRFAPLITLSLAISIIVILVAAAFGWVVLPK